MQKHDTASGSVMRLAGRTLATPVLWYRHTGTGTVLTLVLTSHIGTAGYYAAMAARISELETGGAAVLWEGVRTAPDDEWATATEDEHAAHQVLLTFYRDRPAMIAAHLGWVMQKELPIGAGWINTDLTDLETVRAAGPAAILAMGQQADRALARFGGHRDAYSRVMGSLIMRALARPHGTLTEAIRKVAPDVYAVLLEQRSKIAVAAVDPGRDTVMIWGAEHAGSIEAALTATGWQRTPLRRWLTAGQLPPLPRTLADLAVVAASVAADTWRAARAEALAG